MFDKFKQNKKVTIYKTHDELERNLFAKKLEHAGIWHQERNSEMARNTASFGSNFVDIQKFAGDAKADNRFYYIDVHAMDEAKAKEILGPRCRILNTELI